MTFLFEKTKCKLGKIDVFNVFFFIIIVHCVHRAFVDAGLFLVANKKRWHELKTPRYRITFNMGKFQNKIIFVNPNSIVYFHFNYNGVFFLYFGVKKKKKSVKNHD